MFQGLSPTSIVVFLWWGGVAGDVQNVLTLLSSFSVVEYTRGRLKDPASFWQLSLVEILASCFNGSAKASMHNNDEKARCCRCGKLQIPRCQAVGTCWNLERLLDSEKWDFVHKSHGGMAFLVLSQAPLRQW